MLSGESSMFYFKSGY